MKYTVKKLDRRFRLHREAGFEYMLEWSIYYYTHSQNSVYSDYIRTARLAEQLLGLQYYKLINPDGRWTETQERVGVRVGWVDYNKIRYRIYLRTAKHLTLVQLG